MAQPPIIGNGQAHTVSLAPGSNTATHKQARPAAPAQDAPSVQFKPGIHPAASKPKAAKSAPVTPVQAPASTETGPMLSHHILQRISELQQRNESVRAELGRLPASLGQGR